MCVLLALSPYVAIFRIIYMWPMASALASASKTWPRPWSRLHGSGLDLGLGLSFELVLGVVHGVLASYNVTDINQP